MSAALNFYHNEDRRHMAFCSWSCHTTKISSLMGLLLLFPGWDMTGASSWGLAVLSFSSCSLCTRGPDSCGGDERPSEAVWQCPWCSSLFCQRINVMVHSFTGLLVLRQLPDAGECVSVHFADKEAVNVWFAAGCSISARSALQKKKRAGSHLCNLELPVTSSWLCGDCVGPK